MGLYLRCVSLTICFLVSSFSLSADPITFGVVPQQSAKKMAEKWQPLIDYISNFTGLDIEFKTAKDIPTFESRERSA